MIFKKLECSTLKTAPLGSFLLLYLLENNALAQRRVELLELDFSLRSLTVLASPNNMLGLRRLELKQTVL